MYKTITTITPIVFFLSALLLAIEAIREIVFYNANTNILVPALMFAGYIGFVGSVIWS